MVSQSVELRARDRVPDLAGSIVASGYEPVDSGLMYLSPALLKAQFVSGST